MRILILAIIVGLTSGLRAFAGYANAASHTAANPNNNDMAGFGALANQQAIYREYQMAGELRAAYDQAILLKLNDIYSKDPWRRIDNATNLARGRGWVEFQGIIQDADSKGKLFKGKYGQVLTVWTQYDPELHLLNQVKKESIQKMGGSIKDTTQLINQDVSFDHPKEYGNDLFYVEGFPYPSRGGSPGYEEMMAYESDYCTFTNAAGEALTIHKLIYGTPCIKTWSAEEIAAAKAKVIGDKEAKKKSDAEKILKNNQDLADKGDPYGLCRMGERYRDGDGVDKDLTKAKSYFQRAVAAGSDTATKELRWLPADSKTNSVASNL